MAQEFHFFHIKSCKSTGTENERHIHRYIQMRYCIYELYLYPRLGAAYAYPYPYS